jgi:aryl-phospho-beta-D-glucosidase BglC (GH1 family)
VTGLTYLTAHGAVLKDADLVPYVPRTVHWYGMDGPHLLPEGLDGRSYKTRRNPRGTITHYGILDEIKAAGFNGIRLGICQDITWSSNGSPADWTAANGRRPNTASYYMTYDANPDFFTDATYNDATGAPYRSGSQPFISSLEMLDRIVGHAGSLGLRIILDMHCLAPSYSDQLGNSRAALGALDNGMDVDPAGRVPNWIATKKWFTTATRTAAGQNAGATHEARNEMQIIAAWVALARRYAGNPVVCGLDLINEPTGGSWETTKALSAANLETSLPEFYERAGNAIHAVNPDVLIVCQGATWWRPGMQIVMPGPAGAGNDIYLSPGFSCALQNVATRPVVLSRPGKVVYSAHEYGSTGGESFGSLGPANAAAWKATPKGFNAYYDYDPSFPDNLPTIWRAQWGFIAEQNIAPVWLGEMAAPFVTTVTNDTSLRGGHAPVDSHIVAVPIEAKAPNTDETCTWTIGGKHGSAAGVTFEAAGGSFIWPAGSSRQFVPVKLLAGAVSGQQFAIDYTLAGQTIHAVSTVECAPVNAETDRKWLAKMNEYFRANSIGLNFFAINPGGSSALLESDTSTGRVWSTAARPWIMHYLTPLLDP